MSSSASSVSGLSAVGRIEIAVVRNSEHGVNGSADGANPARTVDDLGDSDDDVAMDEAADVDSENAHAAAPAHSGATAHAA